MELEGQSRVTEELDRLAKYVPQLNERNEQTQAGIVCSPFGSKTTS